jgi:putative ABC transport system permease protein
MVILEGIFITLISSLIGLALGHGVLHLMAVVFEKSDHIGLQAGIFLLDELWIIGGALFIGFLTALIPAMQAYRTDISTVLAQG